MDSTVDVDVGEGAAVDWTAGVLQPLDRSPPNALDRAAMDFAPPLALLALLRLPVSDRVRRRAAVRLATERLDSAASGVRYMWCTGGWDGSDS